MKRNTPLGSRIAEVHNGSALFTGDAGQGESNIRRWVIENDWLEAIIALPLNIFYNTGIATYIWVLTNRKAEHRRGKVQLIDASGWFQPLRRTSARRTASWRTRTSSAFSSHYLGPAQDTTGIANGSTTRTSATGRSPWTPAAAEEPAQRTAIETLRFASGDEASARRDLEAITATSSTPSSRASSPRSRLG